MTHCQCLHGWGGGCHSLEARVSGRAGLQRKTLLLSIQIKKPQKRTKKGGWVGGLELLHQLVRAYCAHLSPDLCSKL